MSDEKGCGCVLLVAVVLLVLGLVFCPELVVMALVYGAPSSTMCLALLMLASR